MLDGSGYSATRHVRRFSLAFIALLAFAVADAAAAEPYSVEDVVHHQVANVRFTADGEGVLIDEREPLGPRAKFLWFDLRDGGNSGAPLSHAEGAEAQDEGYSFLSPSPDSRYVAYVHHRGGSPSAAVYDFQSRHSTELNVVPGDVPYWTWISDHEVLFVQVAPTAPRPAFPTQMSLQWRKMREGSSATASAMGSGRYAARAENNVDEGIAVADVKTGAVRSIGRGSFVEQTLSPDGTRVAVIRNIPAIVNPQSPIWHNLAPTQFVSAYRGPVAVFDINRDTARREIIHSPDALSGSLRWSPSGKHLAFLATESNTEEQLWIYDVMNGSARRVDLRGLDTAPADSVRQRLEHRRPTAIAWLGEDIAVLARTGVPARAQVKNAAAPAERARTDWFLLRSGADPINLTAQFSRVPEVVAITRRSLVMSVDGQVWEVRAHHPRRLLAGEPGKRLRVVPDPAAVLEPITAPPTSTLVLEEESSQGPKTVYFLDLASGHTTGRVKEPAADAKVDAISLSAKRVAFLYRQDNADVIAVADVSGASREVLRLNEFQKDKEIGTFVRIDHKEPKNGQQLTSWLLLPPGYRKGPPLPTVVFIYPSQAYGVAPPEVSPADKVLLLAAHGYAVLFASLPIDHSVLAREPLQGLADEVLSAVDAAKSQGYVDNDRVAIEGRSYGGYGTLGVIGQTDRFKAAVAIAGISDLLSYYGEPEITQRLTGEFEGIANTQLPMAFLETSNGGMGAPPWGDPQRYLRNSPLLHVENIHTPVMLVHGDLDAAVRFSQAEEMFTALYRLNKDAVFVRYWGEGHVVLAPANVRDYWSRVYAWFDRYIGPPFDVAKALSTSH